MKLNFPALRDMARRKTCRTVLDALDRLEVLNAPTEATATIHAGKLKCPNGDEPGLVLIASGSHSDRRFLRMPDSKSFRGKLVDGTPIVGFISELHGGVINPDGTVLLSDGRRVRSVEFQPGVPYRHYEFTALQDLVVRLALRFLEEEDSCYLPVNGHLLPGMNRLDYNAIQRVRIPYLKGLVNRIKQFCCFHISHQEIETALRRAGMQFPKS